MSAFYNEFDPFAAAWLRELVKAGAIEDGTVCEKDMWDVVPSELAGFERVHFCAGIGGWAEALRLAGWHDDQPVWTVSLPCQPFSTAGKGSGLADARGQLAEAFFWLAGVCRPGIIFGEQVEAAIRHDWLDVVASSLESIGYTVGAVGFPAASVGAFHIRQRLYWVAVNKEHRRREGHANIRRIGERDKTPRSEQRIRHNCPACGVADAEGRRCGERRDAAQQWKSGHIDGNGIVGDSERNRLEMWSNIHGKMHRKGFGEGRKPHFWSDAEWIPCRDGKWRPIPRAAQSEVERLVDGVSAGLGLVRLERQAKGEIESEEITVFSPLVARGKNRVGRLRGYGNAICVPAAEEFIMAAMEIMEI